MEGTAAEPLGASLLQWVNSFEAAGKSEQWADLVDGKKLWAILQDVDAGYFAGDLPEPNVGQAGDWTRKWQNLKHLERQLSTYYRDVCNGSDGLAASAVPDLKAAAMSGSRQDLEKLIMVIIRAAMASPESNQRMAHRLMSLGRERAMIIANELRSMEEPEENSETEPPSQDESTYQSEQDVNEDRPMPNGAKSGDAPYRDPQFEREEELLQAQLIIDKLQASQIAAQQQLQELRHDKERLQDAFDAYRAEIDSRGRKPADGDELKKLQRQADNDRGYIDDLERQMQSSRDNMENYERQIERLKSDNEASQKLRDDMQMLKADNEELNQKVRANENLKKKIQTLQEQEKASVTLRDELKVANERLIELEKLRQVQAGLEKEIIEKKGLIRNQEYQINELTTTRKHAEHDARVLAQKLEAARERHDRDHEAMEELRLKLQDTSMDDARVDATPLEQNKRLSEVEGEPRKPLPADDGSKAFAEKLVLLEQQLETADVRLKQASQRNAILEEDKQALEADSATRQTLERQASEQEKTIARLRLDMEAASKEQKQQVQEDVPAHDLAALQKENRLMSSAWYDLSSRLQNNSVSLGRRKHEPKSWIGKQRSLVGPQAGTHQK